MKSKKTIRFTGIIMLFLFITANSIMAVEPVRFQPVKHEKKATLFISKNDVAPVNIRLRNMNDDYLILKSRVKPNEKHYKVWNFEYLPTGRYIIEIDLGKTVVNQYFDVKPNGVKKVATGKVFK